MDFREETWDDNTSADLKLCVVGRFADNRDTNIDVLQHTLEPIWRPIKKMVVSQMAPRHFMFQFFHEKHVRRVMEDGPWTFTQTIRVRGQC